LFEVNETTAFCVYYSIYLFSDKKMWKRPKKWGYRYIHTWRYFHC